MAGNKKGPHKSHPHVGMAHHDTHHGDRSKNHGMAGTPHPMSGEHKSKPVREQFGSGMGKSVRDHKTTS